VGGGSLWVGLQYGEAKWKVRDNPIGVRTCTGVSSRSGGNSGDGGFKTGDAGMSPAASSDEM
jgi:hypothetical protein